MTNQTGQILTHAFGALQPDKVRERHPVAGDLSVVGARVDWLSIGAVIELDRDRLDRWVFCAVTELGEGSPDVTERGVVRVPLGGWGEGLSWADLAVVPLRNDRWKFSNADVHGLVDLHPLHGCQLEVHFSAEFLATNTLTAARAYVRAIAATLGGLVEQRVRRLDLAVDVAGWAIRPEDQRAWVKPGRAGLAAWVDLPNDKDTVRSYGAQQITGFTVAPGGSLSLRNYDKRVELEQRSPHKLAGEEAIWREHGWNGAAPVARVEAQLRGAALRTFGITSPEQIEGALDALWQYVVKVWCRLVVPGTSTRLGRCQVDPRWALIERVRFVHDSLPAARRYMRGGATVQQALGGLLSFICNHEAARDVSLEFLPANAPAGEARAALERSLTSWAVAGAREMAAALVQLHGEGGALEWLNGRAAFALARAFTVGGGAEPPEQERAPRGGPRVRLWEVAA